MKRLFALIFLLFPAAAMAEEVTFSDPMVGRYRLDYCRYASGDCGIGPALQFCRNQGFEMAESYIPEANVTPTQRIGDQHICRAPSCSGFEEIVCSREELPRALRPELNRPERPERPEILPQPEVPRGEEN